jgi:cellulose biosynthesis protein BcsQ
MVSPKAPSEERSDEVLAGQAYLLLARRIKTLGRPVCGLWPIRPTSPFQDVSIRLARALASLGSSTGIIVRQQNWREALPDSQPSIELLSDGVDAITPVRSRSGVSPTLERVLAAVRDRYSYVLLDLAGLDIVSVTEIALLPEVGIILMVAPGSTNEFALAKLRRRLPSERLLGAVLVDQR